MPFQKENNFGSKNKGKIRPNTREQNHINFKGGLSLNKDGYTLQLADRKGKRKHHRQHILIMEKYLGRSLYPHEVIHHINEIKTDNRLENLRLMANSEHAALHGLCQKSYKIIITCKSCSKSFKIFRYLLGKAKFCSKSCAYYKLYQICTYCSVRFKAGTWRLKNRKFCSQNCFHLSRIKKTIN